MKFNISSKTLLSHLNATFKVVNAKNLLSILENFLFILKGNILTVKGSDQENNMQATFEVTDSEGEGMVAVPAKRLIDILKEMPDQGLCIDINDETLNINVTFSQGQFDFMGLPGSEYPEPKARTEDAVKFVMPAQVMYAGLMSSTYAASTESIRPIMTGVCVDFKNESLVLVASDTHKLVKYENSAIKPGFERRFVLPPKAAQLLRSLLEKEEGDLEIEMDERGATFRWNVYELSCVFVTGNYPPYDRVIPRENPFTLEVDRVDFLAASRRMLLMANTGSKLVRLKINADELEMSSRDVDYARSGFEKMNCNYQGNPMTIGFNGEYLVDVVSNMPGDSLFVQLSDPSRPALFVPAEQKEDVSVVVLVMTLQILD